MKRATRYLDDVLDDVLDGITVTMSTGLPGSPGSGTTEPEAARLDPAENGFLSNNLPGVAMRANGAMAAPTETMIMSVITTPRHPRGFLADFVESSAMVI